MARVAQTFGIVTGMIDPHTETVHSRRLQFLKHLTCTSISERWFDEIRWHCGRIGGKPVGDSLERSAFFQPERLIGSQLPQRRDRIDGGSVATVVRQIIWREEPLNDLTYLIRASQSVLLMA